jgi:signal transduction histidine kinase
MKSATKRKATAIATFEEEYREVLTQYSSHGGEAALGRAYELGRRAIAEKKSLMEIAALHHQVLIPMLAKDPSPSRLQGLMQSAEEFLAEALSPYEMAQRGVQDAIAALRQFNQKLEEEIKRIAHAVHDEAGQFLVAVHLALAEVKRELPEPQKEQIGHVSELLNQVENQLRRYSHELRPTILDDLGWIPAIRSLAEGVSKRSNLKIELKTTMANRLPAPVEVALYRIVQEALNNTAKHAKASHVWIRIGKKSGVVSCSIEDDGTGFDIKRVQSDRTRGGLGLIGMKERLNGIGGTLAIDSTPGGGTKISIRLPAEVSNANSNRVSG